MAGFLCWAARLDFFLLWGILAFALNFVPVLGSVIAGVPPFILALLVHGGAQRDGDCDWIHFDQRFLGKFFGADADGSPFWAFDPGGDCFRPVLGVYLGTGGNAPRSSSYDGFESDAR